MSCVCVVCVVCVPLRRYSDECLGSVVDHRVGLFPRNIITYREEEGGNKGKNRRKSRRIEGNKEICRGEGEEEYVNIITYREEEVV
jgi:hypothetical protein